MGREHVCPSLAHAVEFVEGPDCEDTYVSFEDTLYLHQRLMELKIALLFTYDTWRRYGVSSEDTSVSLRHKPSTDSAGFSVTRLVPPSPPTSLTTVRVLSTSLTLQHTYITAFAALAHSVTVTNHGPRAPDILVVVSHASLKPQGVQNSVD